MMIPTVRIGGVVFDGGDGHEGFTIASKGFVGWLDGVTQRRDDTPLPQAHGSFDAPGFGAARVVSIQGLCWADSDRKLGWYGRQLTGLLADGGMDRLVANYMGLEAFADMRLAAGSQTQFSTRIPGRLADYQIQFWAPDPRIFGNTQTFTGTSVTAFHYGNFPADPVVTVVGPQVGGYTITGPGGATFTVTQDPGAGHAHTIDFATGLVSLDGVVQSGVVSSADTWTIPPGQQVAMSISAGSMTVAVKDTFI